jgi:hypothetical protein
MPAGKCTASLVCSGSTWQQVQRMLYFDAEEPNAPLDKVFIAGAAAGVAQCAIATPMELVRSKLQVQDKGGGKAYAGNMDCLKRIYASEGLGGIYRGNVSMMAREAPGFGVYFSVYEATKRALCPGLAKGESEPMWVEAIGGATTGAVTWTAVMPVDVVSTRVSSTACHACFSHNIFRTRFLASGPCVLL